jgi:outer membrane autotransporter protein
MKAASRNFLLVMVGCSGFTATAVAQNLSTYVNDPANGATVLQQNTGNAVQRACAALAGQGGFSLPGAQGDLFRRCNELVQTSQFLQGVTNVTRNLGLSDSELLGAMQQVAGEELLGQTTLSTRVPSGQFSNIAGRLNALRIGGAGAALGGRAATDGPYEQGRNSPAFASISLDKHSLRGGGAASDPDIAGSRLGWFVEGRFETGDRDQTINEDGFDFDATSFTVGLDYMLDYGVIGASIGIDNYEADFENNLVVSGGGIEVDGTSGSLFGALYRGNLYFDGIVSFGSLDTDTTRRAVYSSTNTCAPPNTCPGEDVTLVGSTDGDYMAAGVTVGYDANHGNWDIATTMSLSYREIDIDGYTETDPAGGGLALSFDDQGIESFRSILGIAISGSFSRSFGILSPQFRAEWHHEFQDQPNALIAKYAVEETLNVSNAAGAGVFSLDSARCISCFQINSDEIDSDFGLIGVGLSAVFSQRIQVYGMFETLVELDNISSNSFSVGIRGQF